MPDSTLIASAADHLRRYVRTQDQQEIMSVVHLLAQMRRECATADGARDWAGRSTEYRTAVAAVYERAGVLDQAERNRVRGLISYHMAQVIREMAPAEELRQAGIGPKTRQEAQRERRGRVSAVARAVGATRRDPVQTVAGADALMELVSPEDMREIPQGDRAGVVEMLESLRAKIAGLLTALQGHGPA